MQYTLRQIHAITGGEAAFGAEDSLLLNIGFDSRRLHNPGATVFVCLGGEKVNGNQFVGDAAAKGVRNVIARAPFDISAFPGMSFIIHPDPLKALQQLAEYHRRKFTGPVIGITGSNGKTIVKEWLFALLQHEFVIARSPRSYNSSLGAAISVLGIEPVHNMAILEAGISKPGDMNSLQSMIQPSLGIFTSLGSAHDENFESRSEKASEKIKLFEDADVLVYPYDQDEIRNAVAGLKARKPLLQTIGWGRNEGAKYRITGSTEMAGSTIISFLHRGTGHQIQIPFRDAASVENAMSCLCALSALERWDEAHLERFKTLPTVENRLVFAEGKNGNYLVNDSYSNDTDSLQVALDFMLRQQPDMPHMVILSDLEQSAADKDMLYRKVAAMLREKGSSELIGIGTEMAAAQSAFSGIKSSFFPDTEALLGSGMLNAIRQHSVLIKGARSYRLERVVEAMRRQSHQTVLQIDLNALWQNYTTFRNMLKPGTRMMAMVKAFGYGSGSFEAARTLQFMGADYLAVAYTDEGVALRKAGIHTPVMVMNSTASEAAILAEFQLEPVLFSASGIRDLAATGIPLQVHLEVDTGMHRLGFNPDTIAEDIADFPKHLKVVSVFSHLSASEAAAHDAFTHLQIQTFIFVCTNVENVLGYSFLRHIANTGAILRFSEAHFDMVRLGIGLYGVDPGAAGSQRLETVATLRTVISQLRLVKAGDSVGYSRKAIGSSERLIATLPIGYADGLWRVLGNGNGGVVVNGTYAPFVGNICMDMCMVDVTGIDCAEGDAAELFGAQQSVEVVAQKCGTIAYEILTAVSQRVRREYLGEN